MKTPHKHAALIKAWAEGAEIQYQAPTNMTEAFNAIYNEKCPMKWCDIKKPTWDLTKSYRIKPSAPVEPNYEKINKYGWKNAVDFQRIEDCWKEGAQLVIDTYKKYQEDLKEFNKER
jgi:hypothetical protein